MPTSKFARRAIQIVLSAAGLLLLLSGSVWSAPNGLTQIPIAKVFGDGVASFSLARVVENDQSTTYTTQYGIGNQFEFGFDYQAAPADQTTYLDNFKVLVAHKPGSLPDIAVGMTNVATGQKAVPYAVAKTQPKATGISLGVIRPNSANAYEGMAGVSYNVTPTVRIVTDYINSHDNYGTLGVIANLTKTITLNLGACPRISKTVDFDKLSRFSRDFKVKKSLRGTPESLLEGRLLSEHQKTLFWDRLLAYANANGDADPRGYIFNLAYTFHLKPQKSEQPNSQNKNPTPGSELLGSNFVKSES